jgi:hypothetical protein
MAAMRSIELLAALQSSVGPACAQLRLTVSALHSWWSTALVGCHAGGWLLSPCSTDDRRAQTLAALIHAWLALLCATWQATRPLLGLSTNGHEPEA